jgi:hypothetical protein
MAQKTRRQKIQANAAVITEETFTSTIQSSSSSLSYDEVNSFLFLEITIWGGNTLKSWKESMKSFL